VTGTGTGGEMIATGGAVGAGVASGVGAGAVREAAVVGLVSL